MQSPIEATRVCLFRALSSQLQGYLFVCDFHTINLPCRPLVFRHLGQPEQPVLSYLVGVASIQQWFGHYNLTGVFLTKPPPEELGGLKLYKP